ncbi:MULTISPECIES: motility protein A [Thiomicrorhabdus]|uniref:MotA/TolQ/ExbB proton channel family protein n=1 Tax=Thiomicrorhabdus xiamenensis TaxID=2739063 RepID=A0A7D4SXW9_9GAMM|nr:MULTISPECIES: MotA/TolQ/ExbB proton channel family protein [Thiomicrorhabdus]MBO1923838.1 MotA/TolQ/ExbB proton channel family protein [Thiomicrorhabdus sp. 6S3-12]QKI88564.1 MotA/TolQ/ExbB proton channel family protein [Thiomicrorhabdus xiamenensis]
MNISISALFGFILGLGLFIAAIIFNTDNYLMFFSLSSLLMVIGGTIAAAMISYDGRYVMLAFKEIMFTMVSTKVNPIKLYEDVGDLIDWSKIIRKQGLVMLEKVIDMPEDGQSFLNQSFVFLLSGYKGGHLYNLLQHSRESIYDSNMRPAKVLQTMAATAPAFGMVGTLVGLIIMLNSMEGDPSKIGGGLAVALLTTLYGVLIAQLILKPAARKLEHKQDLEAQRNQILSEGIVLLSEGASPSLIEDTMNSYLHPKYQFRRAER